MTVLRSREVVPAPKSVDLLKKRKKEVVEPSTPEKSVEALSNLPGETTPLTGSSRKRSVPPDAVPRRSLRLSAKFSNAFSDIITASNGCDLGNLKDGDGIEKGGLGLEEKGDKIMGDVGKHKLVSVVEELTIRTDTMLNICGDHSREPVECSKKGSRVKRRRMEMDTIRLKAQTEVDTSLSLRSGKKIIREVEVNNGGSVFVAGGNGGIEGGQKSFPDKGSEDVSKGSGATAMTNLELNATRDGKGNLERKRLTVEEKGKGKVAERPLLMASNSVKFEVDLSNNSKDVTVVNATRRLSRNEKGKGVVIDSDLSKDFCTLNKDSGSKVETSHAAEHEATQHGEQIKESTVNVTNAERGYRKQFKDIAKRSAPRFAHFSSQGEGNLVVDEAVRDNQPPKEVLEDWPGPFSTAMKIIQDREKNMHKQTETGSVPERMVAPLLWNPKKDTQPNQRRKVVPLLRDLCMHALVKNADGVTSLDCIPDVLKHELCHLLCDSRKMNCHFLGLLTSGSPTEIRLTDCSWLTEELFVNSFERCGTGNLTVLQLDQCGRCLPDYTLLATLARLPNSLPALTTISLKAACRLSDIGLTALVSSAPSLRSINLSQCSLLSSNGIKCLSDSLGSVLKELYLDDCEAIDCSLVLPFLLKLEHLEVLSVAGIPEVCDDFVIEFVTRHGHNMRELVLKDCKKLTDRSVKAVAESCPRLCAIDLSNLCGLTDYSIGYLANGCRALHKLKLCRNAFSDEAIAAYLETSGKWLKELSLNNIKKVSHNTAMSVAEHCRNLVSLDVSWCRNLTDEALGLIADSCLSLEVLKVFGCTQITKVFLDGHSNPQVKIIGMKLTPVMEHLSFADPLQQGPLLYSSA
ncbi:PREDICTED: uncharacterized protein LOC109186126 [Ipomoea nil]|uniref:uncharacterized protein LOC109186126 n=1 Tax=Ipomoea nil TaxID=35883 RepID=UPI0009019906|nr:PREDICTED: uncharacterized protein LOC109186126 [Ipomoea nil]XP_019191583.1 PREDICTED: uncharacterized protein LOC109186126 [Ipomoea nil]